MNAIKNKLMEVAHASKKFSDKEVLFSISESSSESAKQETLPLDQDQFLGVGSPDGMQQEAKSSGELSAHSNLSDASDHSAAKLEQQAAEAESNFVKQPMILDPTCDLTCDETDEKPAGTSTNPNSMRPLDSLLCARPKNVQSRVFVYLL